MRGLNRLQAISRCGAIVSRPLRNLRSDLILRKLLRGRDCLILASGPSGAELQRVPRGMLLCSCNLAPALLVKKGIERRVDLYTSSEFNLREHNLIRAQEALAACGVNVFTFDSLGWAKQHFPGVYSTLAYDDHMDNRLLNALISPYSAADLRGGSLLQWTSTGVRLLQYALYFGAKEIYLSGLDLNTEEYATGGFSEMYREWHLEMDHNIIGVIAGKYKNIYVASEKSGLAEYFPYKTLAED